MSRVGASAPALELWQALPRTPLNNEKLPTQTKRRQSIDQRENVSRPDEWRFHYLMVIEFHQPKQFCTQTDRFRRLRHLSEGGRAGKTGGISGTLGPEQTTDSPCKKTNKHNRVAGPPPHQ